MTGLLSCAEPLATRYDVALLDLDGVVYVGSQAVPAASAAVASAREAGMRLAFVTNNASRTPEQVAERLASLGVAAAAADVVTSAQAAGRLLQERLRPGDGVLVVGTEALRREVVGAGLAVVTTAPLARGVVQGYTAELTYADLVEATLAIRSGAVWVAANLDPTIPSPRGLLPGNGASVAALVAATGREPEVAGKPERALHAESVRRTGARRPLVVGDRLDTDIEGAVGVGCDSLLVLSGVSSAADVLLAGPHLRPSYLGTDLGALLDEHPEITVHRSAGRTSARCRSTEVSLLPGVEVRAERGADPLDGLRAACALCWCAADAGRPVDPDALLSALQTST